MPDFPSGTLTFLFTDIERSTRLRERDRHVIAAAVDRHLALLDTTIASHHGEPVGACQ
jgi:class 3 adenylate cyclase